jgi:hypothetical protein
MPLVIDTEEDQPASDLEALVEKLHQDRFDPTDHDSFIEFASALKALGNNRTFLAEMICKELGDYRSIQPSNSYSPQVFMLYGPQRRGQSFFIRACLWASENEQIMKVSGTDPFFYYKPHDHNFNFMTVGYHGPGYWSDYYEYEYKDKIGYKGEDADLKFVERTRLEAGKVMLYRAFTDIHNQLPADRFSISLNIMENTMRSSVMDQYAFDIDKGSISGVINRIGAAPLFHILAAHPDSESQGILEEISRKHPLERVRMCAYHALASAKTSAAEALELYAGIGDTDPAFLREWSRIHTADLEKLVPLPTVGLGGTTC